MAQKVTELSDSLLLQQSDKGDDLAFNELFRRYFTKLYKYTLSFTKDNLVAEELVMDVMLSLWQRRGSIVVADSLSPYLFKAMKNTLINHWRKKALETTGIGEGLDYADTRSADHDMLATELHDQYKLHLEALSPQRKKVFELSRNEDLTYPEIATRLNLSVRTVEHHMSASLIILRKKLKTIADPTIILVVVLLS
jgi:RNA polymerase sigma-70 factor (family 1)